MTVLEEMKTRDAKLCFFRPGADRDEAARKAEELGIAYQRGCVIHDRLAEPDAKECAFLEEKRKGDGRGGRVGVCPRRFVTGTLSPR